MYCVLLFIIPWVNVIKLFFIPGDFVIVCDGFGRLYLFQDLFHENIKIKILKSASANLGQSVKVLSAPITLENFQLQRFGIFRI